MLQLREKEIFETLKKISKFDFVIIGGYAANAYALPRFSVDCDIVVKERPKEMEKILESNGYKLENAGKQAMPYGGHFLRYEKTIEKDFKVSMDILVKEILDRQTNSVFSAEWIFMNSSLRLFKGKTIAEELKLRIIGIDALIAMKFISCRSTDIRDIFMLMPSSKDKAWIKKEISSRCSFEDRFSKVKGKITSPKFKDDLQGVYGFVNESVFEKHKKAVLSLFP
ncbi:MAG: hypothetical protein KKC75_02675 [Nanoarchaeota archaeon]|nr:hypothetical protein [Nanoarchaeota archaeon]MBU1004208.1 hypothetical protein [Nanoarchaeota archaeon]MBU1946165.1 hypothetical protein [Nanoarchaeota archaeon]